METIVGLMFNYNEADLLPQILESAIRSVDTLFIADDGSTDDSWGIIQTFKRAYPDKIEYTRNTKDAKDKGQRQALLDAIRERYKPEDSWVQVIESDIMILDTDVREAIKNHAVSDIGVTWQLLNGICLDWEKADTYPYWGRPLREIMYRANWMEVMLYTFRPLPDLSYTANPVWRPWPTGFSKYTDKKLKIDNKTLDAPLLAHFGYRGPTHFYEKYKHKGKFHSKYTDWDLTSPETIRRTVPLFNGKWRGRILLSREGWQRWRKDKIAARVKS